MKTKISVFTLILLISVLMIQCSKDDTNQSSYGQLNLKMTDAPSDDVNIQGTFVTVANVKVDGQSVEGFTKQTIKVSDLQSGKTEVLFNGNLQANTYSNITLVLDYESDASGNSPGCYALDKANNKHDLNSSSSATGEIKLDKSILIDANGTTELVVDFDLRKSIVYNSKTSEASKYKFVTEAELKNSLRVENPEKCGDIKGKVNNNQNTSELIVYAYHKGDYSASIETQGQGNSSVSFAKAVTSAKVDTDGTYQLSFLNEGDYEIHVAAYNKDAASGKLVFKGLVNANSSISGLLLNNVSVQANSHVELNFDISILL